MASDLRRALFIGCGRAGRGTLTQFLKQPRTAVAAIVDPQPPDLSGLLPEAPPVFTDLDEALRTVDADMAFISSPNCFHARQFLRCAQRGIHVWVEKPVALRVEDAMEMQQAAEQTGIKVATPYAAEMSPDLVETAVRFASGELGSLVQLLAVCAGSNGFFSEGRGGHYAVNQPDLSGGWIFHCFCHVVDWVLRIGGPVAWVYCETASTVPNARPDQEEAVTCVLHFRGGGTATLVENQLAFKYHRYAVMGDRGGVFAEHHPRAQPGQPCVIIETGIGTAATRQTLDAAAIEQRRASSAGLMTRFLDAIEHDRPSPVPLCRGVETLRVCQALRTAAQTRQVVTLANEPGAVACPTP